MFFSVLSRHNLFLFPPSPFRCSSEFLRSGYDKNVPSIRASAEAGDIAEMSQSWGWAQAKLGLEKNGHSLKSRI